MKGVVLMKFPKLVRTTIGGPSKKRERTEQNTDKDDIKKSDEGNPAKSSTEAKETQKIVTSSESPTKSTKEKQEAALTIDLLKQHTHHISDIIYKKVPTSEGVVTVIYCRSLVEKMTLMTMVLIPLTNYIHQIHQIAEEIDVQDNKKIVSSLLSGKTLLNFQEKNLLLSMDTYSAPTRAITNTETESTVIGPQDAFTESMETNISLIKRRVQNPMLKNEEFIVGKETNTRISLVYVKGIVNNKNLEELKNRIEKINYPSFTDISTLKQLVEDNPYSPFPQYYMTVRPDTSTRFLLDGRILIFMDNSQAAIVCPTSFMEMFTSIEDYYNRWTTATLLRMLRFFGFFLTIILTPTYISALSFHPEILPYDLLLNLQESREKVPFPPFLEVLIIELIIEILREAGSRMPAKVGQTIGIVGGIVIGTAAVEAGLISNILIVLVATSALLSFLPPIFLMSNASRFVRYIFIVSAGLFGLYGQMLALTWLLVHLLGLKSLGVPLMTPVIPRKATDLLDSIIRFPIALLTSKTGLSRVKKK